MTTPTWAKAREVAAQIDGRDVDDEQAAGVIAAALMEARAEGEAKGRAEAYADAARVAREFGKTSGPHAVKGDGWANSIAAAIEARAKEMGRTLLLASSGQTFVLSNEPIWVRPIALVTLESNGYRDGIETLDAAAAEAVRR